MPGHVELLILTAQVSSLWHIHFSVNGKKNGRMGRGEEDFSCHSSSLGGPLQQPWNRERSDLSFGEMSTLRIIKERFTWVVHICSVFLHGSDFAFLLFELLSSYYLLFIYKIDTINKVSKFVKHVFLSICMLEDIPGYPYDNDCKSLNVFLTGSEDRRLNCFLNTGNCSKSILDLIYGAARGPPSFPMYTVSGCENRDLSWGFYFQKEIFRLL